MVGMNLRSLDLNLLVVLDALLTERHVTRAGAAVGLTQSATSSALGRLREMLGDPLLVRGATGMELTPRALELVEPLRQTLRQTANLFESRLTFDSRQAQRSFRVRMSDALGHLLLAPVMKRLRREAPGVDLDIVHLPPAETVDALEEGAIDLAISMDLRHAGAIRSAPLLKDRMVCVLDRKHPAAKQLTLERFLAAAHIKVSISSTDGRYVDAVLAESGLSRRVVLNVPNWLVVPEVLRGSELMAVMSERLARRFVEGLAVKPVPYPKAAFVWSMYWHQRHDQLPAQTWLRSVFRTVADEL
jgi:DNA-binding transcriptional LysR family regulator